MRSPMAEVSRDPPQIADRGQPNDSAHELGPPWSRDQSASWGDGLRPVQVPTAARLDRVPLLGRRDVVFVDVSAAASGGCRPIVRIPTVPPSRLTATRPPSLSSTSASASSRLASAATDSIGVACDRGGSGAGEALGDRELVGDAGSTTSAAWRRAASSAAATSAASASGATSGAGSMSSSEIARDLEALQRAVAPDEVGDEVVAGRAEDPRRACRTARGGRRR